MADESSVSSEVSSQGLSALGPSSSGEEPPALCAAQAKSKADGGAQAKSKDDGGEARTTIPASVDVEPSNPDPLGRAPVVKEE